MEMFIGIVAACVPTLKPIFQKLLTDIGIDFTSDGSYSFFSSHNNQNTTIGPVGRTLNDPQYSLSFLVDGKESSKPNGTLEKSRSASDGHEEWKEHSKKGETEFVSTSTV